MILNFPLNKTSFGNVSSCILRTFFEQKEDFNFFPISGNMELSTDNKEFGDLLQRKAAEFVTTFSKKDPALKLWHIFGAHESLSDKRYLLTFHETDRITPLEKNVLKNHEKVLVSSHYTKQVFEAAGLSNVVYCPLGFDNWAFSQTSPSFLRGRGIISFGLQGKLEKRKAHFKVIKAWVKKYGGDKNFRLDCSIVNPFLIKHPPHVSPEERKEQEALQTKKIVAGKLQEEKIDLPWNVNFLPYEESPAVYNKVLNHQDICLTGMSYAEGFNLPLFHSLCLGKQAVVFNAHVHKDYCNQENSFLVDPNGSKLDSSDGTFFNKGGPINQGEYDDWNEDEFLDQCEAAVKVAYKENSAGVALKDKFSWGRTCQIITKTLK